MIELMKKMFGYIPFPIWIRRKNEIIYINEEFKKVFNLDIKELVEQKIMSINEINCIVPISDDIFSYKDKRYGVRVISEKIDNEDIEIVLLLEQQMASKDMGVVDSVNVLQTVIDNVPEIVFYKDTQGKYRAINKQCKEFYSSKGISNVIGKSDLELSLDKRFIKTCTEHDKKVMNTKKQLLIDEMVTSEGGAVEVFETIKTPVLDSNEKVCGIVGVVRDVTSRRKIENKLMHLSYTDTLTGLYNRAYFDEKISELVDNKEFPVGIIMGDVNGLKIVNDTIGHHEGDKLIVEIANRLKTVCGEDELVFRWGGDEFIILVPNSTEEKCERLIDKMNQMCEDACYDKFKLSMSMGVSMLEDENDIIDRVLKDAENKLYRQKILVGKSMRSSIVSTLKESLQAKNVETEEHTERVLKYSLAIGRVLKLKSETLDELALVAKLHDIGKIGIAESILLKPEKLTEDEYEIMKTHSEKGYRLALTLPELSHIARGILTHHERWDGKGYPLGIAGEEIPLVARIVSVVDAFDAMTNNRVYNRVKTKEDAIQELIKGAEKQFDPKIVEIFCTIID